MKKLLMMAAIAALSHVACGSVSTFSWTLDVDRIDKAGAEVDVRSLTAYLIDTSIIDKSSITGHAVLDVAKGYDVTGWTDNTETHVRTYSVATDPNTGVAKYQLSAGNDAARGTYIQLVKQSSLDENYYGSENLAVFVISSDTGRYQQVQLKPTGSAFWGEAEFSPAPIPEPTSGMLALLGVMGLMLRRRRAA